jgi:broad-specificity NMP kinase
MYRGRVITNVLGAPGSGKSTVARPLAALLTGHVVLDWDAFMGPASALAGREIRQSPATWPAYRHLIQTVLDAVKHLPVILLSVCTPAELHGWPIDAWAVLDCTDEERRRRLAHRDNSASAGNAISDAQEYRALGLPVIDTTGLTPEAVAEVLATFVRRK